MFKCLKKEEHIVIANQNRQCICRTNHLTKTYKVKNIKKKIRKS